MTDFLFDVIATAPYAGDATYAPGNIVTTVKVTKSATPAKVTITEKLIEKNRKDIILTIDKDSNYCTEICLIEIEKFLKDKVKENNKLEKLINYFNKDEDGILFLGII